MKKYIWFIVAFLAVVGIYLAVSSNANRKVLGTESTGSPAPSGSYSNLVGFEFKGKRLNAAWYKVTDPFNLSLIANFNEKDNASDVLESKGCKFITNAGFYLEDSTPAGFFTAEGVTLRNYSRNTLFDGILSVNYLGTPRITREVLDGATRIGIQTGPIIKENAEFKKLNITSDKEARRMVAAVTGYNELYFLAFYDSSSVYLGPNLDDMPEVLETFEEKTGIIFADAINLDGGSASAFYADGFTLSELSPVGAFFCEK